MDYSPGFISEFTLYSAQKPHPAYQRIEATSQDQLTSVTELSMLPETGELRGRFSAGWQKRSHRLISQILRRLQCIKTCCRLSL